MITPTTPQQGLIWVGVQPTLSPNIYSDFTRVIHELNQRDYAPATRLAYKKDIIAFITWYAEYNEEMFTFSRLTVQDAKDYRNSLINKVGPSTINRKLQLLSTFCSVAVELEILTRNPFAGIKKLRIQPQSPKSLTKLEKRKLLKELELKACVRDRLITQFMLGAGLRMGEVAKLELNDIEVSERKGSVLIRNGKGNKTRTVPLNLTIRGLFDEYMEERRVKDQKMAEKLFQGERGALTSMAITKIVEKYATEARIKCTPHQLRHTFAYNYLNATNNDLVGLAQILGHSDINTTAIYTKRREADLQENVEKLTQI